MCLWSRRSSPRKPVDPRSVLLGTGVFTETHTDEGDFYSAAGVFEFRRTLHAVEHFTFSNGVVRVDLMKGHFHMFGDG